MTASIENDRSEGGPAHRRRRWSWAWLVVFAVAGAVGGLGWELWRVVVGANWHEVLPGRVYRSAQLSQHELEERTARHGIRTVINLRGNCFPEPWYVGESRATHKGGVSMEDVSFSANRYPSRTELKRLLEVIDQSEYPILLHCRRGADRTGMACAIIMLLQPDGDLAQARRQLGPRYGHVALVHTASLDAFFALYEDWLRQRGQQHSPDAFRAWVLHDYHAGPASCVFERCPSVLGPIPPGQPQAVPIRLRNDSTEPWHFRATDNAGVHLCFEVFDRAGKRVAFGKAGVFERLVAPGERIDLTVALPGLPKDGTYRLFLDMMEEGREWFYQMGSEPCVCEVRVGE